MTVLELLIYIVVWLFFSAAIHEKRDGNVILSLVLGTIVPVSYYFWDVVGPFLGNCVIAILNVLAWILTPLTYKLW